MVSAIELIFPIGDSSMDPSVRSSYTSTKGGHGVASPSGKQFMPTLETVSSGVPSAGMELMEAGKGEATGSSGPRGGNGRSPLVQLLTNGVYMCTVLGCSSFFFVVTGIQVCPQLVQRRMRAPSPLPLLGRHTTEPHFVRPSLPHRGSMLCRWRRLRPSGSSG